jgi:hypothetical protein
MLQQSCAGDFFAGRQTPFLEYNLLTVLQIEAPYEPPPKIESSDSEDTDEESTPSAAAKAFKKRYAIANQYRSIGEFYDDLGKSACLFYFVSHSHLMLLVAVLTMADKYIDFGNIKKQFQGSDFFDANMIQISSQASAQQALTIIVGQGEGSVGVEDAHYQMFLNLYRHRKEWTCWPVVESPTTAMYKTDPFLYQVRFLFFRLFPL